MNRLVFSLVTVVAAAATLACSSVLGFKDFYVEADAQSDATSDALAPDSGPIGDAGDAGDASDAAPVNEASPACPLGGSSLPGPPPRNDGTGGLQLTLAVEVADFGLPPDAGALPTPPGLNLDCVSTCPGPSSCGDPCPSVPPCDDTGGRDTAANTLIGLLGTYEPNLSPQALNGDVQNGDFGMVLRIDEYNGTANDTQVAVELFPSSGTVQIGGRPTRPRFDGTDVWLPTSAGVVGGDAGTTITQGVFTDPRAYVTGGVLVFHVAASDDPAAAFPLFIAPRVGVNDNPIVFHLQYVVGTATLVQDDAGGWHAENGNVTGRWPADDALRGIATLTNTTTGNSLCGSDFIFLAYADQVCQAADIATSVTRDNLSPPAPCDALSFGIGFRAGPAMLANAPWDPPVVPPQCPAGWSPTCAADSGIGWTCQ